MSRRKVRGLTRTGRQVSEDPDLDVLLSNLSPEQIEELEKEVLVAPNLDPNEERAIEQPATNTVRDRDAKLDSRECPGKLSQKEQSIEGEPKKESRKQEYLRKMGLSQEGKEGRGIRRQSSITTERVNKMEERNDKRPDRTKEDRVSLSNRYRTEESKDKEVKETSRERFRREERKDAEVNDTTGDRSRREESHDSDVKDTTREKYRRGEKRDSDVKETSRDRFGRQESRDSLEKGDAKERERNEDNKLMEKRDKRLSTSNKTKEMISKLQEKKENEAIKGKERKEDMKKRDENKTRGLVSKFVEKQSRVAASQTEDKKNRVEEKDKPGKDKSDSKLEIQQSPAEKESGSEKQEEKEDPKEKAKEDSKENKKDVGLKRKESIKEKDRRSIRDKEREEKRETEEKRGKDANEGLKSSKIEEQRGNCVTNKSTPSKTKVEEEEDEDSSMFSDLIEQVCSNDPTMTELNVNNSEVIKAKTLIQFAEALNKNTHIKTFALANCRADDHVAYAIAGTLRTNTSITSINLDSNLLTPKGIMALIQALQKNTTLTELRFHNQRHICGGKTEMEMTKILKDNTTLLKLGYGFELAGPRMTMTNILSRNMDKQRQRRLQEQKLAQANGEKKGMLEVPKTAGGFLRVSPKASPKPSPHPSPMPSPKLTQKRGPGGGPPPPPPPGGPPPPPPPMLDIDSLRNSLTPASQRKMDDKANKAGGTNSRDQLLDSIRNTNMKKLKKVAVPKLLQ
ncbi:leiomodin-1-like [Oncorhynchus kisutch]|uniref:Leiomodin-3 n=1 Tax=Oncorhynchus kisutch TaxID=8019 RepID=A0A8C7DZ86_ONCKI|nr:leiomodin-1-like [Oncorhynchus kisutch]